MRLADQLWWCRLASPRSEYRVDPDSDESAAFIAKCLSICTQYDLSAEDFATRFDSWRFTLKLKKQCTIDDLDRLGSFIGDSVEAERRRAQKHTGGIKLKTEVRPAASLVRPSQRAANSYDHASLTAAFGGGADDMDDLFSDAPVVVKKEPIDVDALPDASPAKRKIGEVLEDGDADEDGASRKKVNREGEEAEAEADSSSPTAATPASTAVSATSAAPSRPFRPSFLLLARDTDGKRNEALYPKALGKYVSRTNAGEKAVALNEYNLARLEPSDGQ